MSRPVRKQNPRRLGVAAAIARAVGYLLLPIAWFHWMGSHGTEMSDMVTLEGGTVALANGAT